MRRHSLPPDACARFRLSRAVLAETSVDVSATVADLARWGLPSEGSAAMSEGHDVVGDVLIEDGAVLTRVPRDGFRPLPREPAARPSIGCGQR